MSVINLNQTPVFQSGYTYLQAAGSDGSDQTPAGFHLKWDFLRTLGDNHLPKGNYAQTNPYQTTIGFNKTSDYVSIYKVKFDDSAFRIVLNTNTQPDDMLLVNNKWNWVYNVVVSRDKSRTIRLIFNHTENYNALADGSPVTGWQNFLAAYEGVVELHVDNTVGATSDDSLAFFYEFSTTQPNVNEPFLLRVEAVGIPDSLDSSVKQVNLRKKYISPTGSQKFYSENTDHIRFDTSNAKITSISLILYTEFIRGVNLGNGGNGDWSLVGNEFALTLDDNKMDARFMPTYIDGTNGYWPKFNDSNSSGEFRVNKENYYNRWRDPAYSFDPGTPASNDRNGLQYFIHDYLVKSTTDTKAIANLPSDIEEDQSVQTISYLAMLKLLSLDFHLSRIFGLGHIDLSNDSYQYVYCLVYQTSAGLDGSMTTSGIRTHLYMTLPTSNTTFRLPKSPVLDECTFGVEIPNGTDIPSAITDVDGYAAQEQLRFININRKPYNHEYGFGAFFNRPEEFDLSLETQPIAYGIEYKEYNEVSYRKPEISNNSDYLDEAGIPETVPIMENGTPRIFTHQEDEEGTHEYAAYAINWFSRVSPLSNTKQVTTDFPTLTRLMPPFNYAVQLIQDEDPSEVEIEDKTLLLTTTAEQELLEEIPENEDSTLVRTSFDWNHIHNHAHPTVDYAEFFFREDEPSVVKGKVTNVTLVGSDMALVETGTYQITSVFPAETVQPNINSSEAAKYIGSFFSSGSSHYVIESIESFGNNPSIKVRVLKQNQAAAPDPTNQNQFLSQETIELPEIGDLFFLIENTGDPTNWDLRHTERIYIEKHYFNESIGLRYSPTQIIYYPIKSLYVQAGSTIFRLTKQLKSQQITGLSAEYVIRPKIVGLTTNSITVSGNWITDIELNKPLRIFGNERNDGSYTTVSGTYLSGSDTTVITIQESLASDQLIDGVVHMIVSRPVTGIGADLERISINGDRVSEFKCANIEYVTETDGSQTRYVVGGVNHTVTFQPLLDDNGNGTGFIQAFSSQPLPDHPDSRVSWYKGTVRMKDLTNKMQTYPISYIGNLTSTTNSGLSFVVQDPGFIPFDENDPADSYSFDLNLSQTVNFHPSYRFYLKESNGVHPVSGVAIPQNGVHFDEHSTLVQGNDPLLLSRQTLMSVRSFDAINHFYSFLSSPVVVFAQKITVPVAPGKPIGPVYATRPNYFGKSSYTFDTKVNTSNNRSPYSMIFYRASDDAILDMLYSANTVKGIKTAFEGLPQSLVNDQQLWEILINAIPDPLTPEAFKTLNTTDGSFTWPTPDNINFYIQYETNLPLEPEYVTDPLCRPFNESFTLNGIVTVYGKNMTGIELVKMAVQNAFTPLNEQPPLYGHFNQSTRQTSSAASVIRDTNGHLLDPATNDIYPMIRKFDYNGDTIVRFTDYNLDGASINKYFYRAMELDDKFKFSPPSGTLGPVILVNALAPDQPQIRKVLTQLPDVINQTPAAVLFELNPFISRLKISKFEVYRAINEDDALSVRTMQKVKVIGVNDSIIDDFENDSFPLYGEELYYRLVAIREITDVADVMISDETITIDAPSKPSAIVHTNIVDSINPEAPELAFVFGNVTTEMYEEVTILWSATCYNGTYTLQKMNSRGNWNEVFKIKQTSGSMNYSATMLPREDENENPIYHRYRVVVENSSGLFNLVQKEYILGQSFLVQEDFGKLDLEDNSGSIII
jgi:hypothetical protein